MGSSPKSELFKHTGGFPRAGSGFSSGKGEPPTNQGETPSRAEPHPCRYYGQWCVQWYDQKGAAAEVYGTKTSSEKGPWELSKLGTTRVLKKTKNPCETDFLDLESRPLDRGNVARRRSKMYGGQQGELFKLFPNL
jgi:hypothetical protein